MPVKGKEVLVIDDAADIRLRYRKTLESIEVLTSEAASTPEGLDYLSRARKLPDLIVLDLKLKGSTGFEFLTARKASRLFASVPVIVSSGLSDRVSVAKAIALGADDYILKPINSTAFLQRVRKHLEGERFEVVDLKDRLPVSIVLDATVTKIEKTAFVLECAARIAKDTRIELPQAALEELAISQILLVSRSEPGPVTMTGNYQTSVEVIGLSGPVRSAKKAK